MRTRLPTPIWVPRSGMHPWIWHGGRGDAWTGERVPGVCVLYRTAKYLLIRITPFRQSWHQPRELFCALIEKERLVEHFSRSLAGSYFLRGCAWRRTPCRGRPWSLPCGGGEGSAHLWWAWEGMFSFLGLFSPQKQQHMGSATSLPAMFRIPPG